MNTQSLSPSHSLSQSFFMNFGPAQQGQQSEGVKNNAQNVAQNRLAEDSYKPSKPAAINSTPVNTSMQKPAMSFSRSESINLQFTTKEGDVVTINFKRSESRGSDPVSNEQNQPATKPVSASIAENNANKVNQQSPSNADKGKENEVASKPTRAPVKPTQQPSVNNTKVTPENTSQAAKPNASQPAKIQNEAGNKDGGSTGSNKLVANRRTDVQMEQRGNKLKASKEENYSLELANNTNKKTEKQTTVSQKPITNSSSQSPLPTNNKAVPANAENSKPPVNSINQPVKQQNITTTDAPIGIDNITPNGGNSLHIEQSFNKVGSDGSNISFSSDFSLTIEGDINDAERQSITNLMQAMSQISHDFFQGGASNSFSQAQNMGFETDQIASFSMNANNQQSVKAMTAYQQTAMPEQNINTQALSEAGEFLSQAKTSMANTGTAVESFAEPKQSFTDMFANIGQLFHTPDMKEDNNHGDMFLKMIENISHDLFNKNQIVS